MDREVTTDKGWFLIDHYDPLDGSVIQLIEITPQNDIRDHITSEECECDPHTREFNIEGIPMLIHNSFDGREWEEARFRYARGH